MIPIALLLAAGLILLAQSQGVQDRQLSRSFWLREMAVSSSFPQLATMPPEGPARELERGALDILQPLRDRINVPVHVTSGYRSSALNAAVGGSDTSDHAHGQAVDISAPPYTDEQLIAIVREMHLDGEIRGLDQCISYTDTGHLHIGWGPRARGEFLVAYRDAAGKRRYRPWTA